MSKSKGTHGLALVELLLVMAIMITVMTLVASYLAEQRDLTVRTQARSEVQDRVRLVMQMVTQDLQVVGSRSYVNTSGNIDFTINAGCNNTSCLTSTDSGVQDSFSSQYVSKLWAAASACRNIAYSFDTNNADTVLRSDVTCANAGTPVPRKLAANILALDIVYQCSDTGATTTGTITGCPSQSYPRSARVTVIGKSRVVVSNISASSFVTSSGATVSCAATYICMSLTQEVLMPNLKD